MINNDLCILGSTGSIGSQTLEVAEHLGLRAIFLAGGRNVPLMETQARRFLPRAVAMGDSGAARDLKVRLADTPIQVLSGGEGVCALAADRSAGTVVTAITGLDGLAPTLAALEGGRRVALAGKESLVCAGSLVMKRAKEQNSVILPVDSEHSAIFQCLQTERGGVADADAQRTDAQRSDAPWTAALRTDAPWTDALRAGDVEKLILTASGGPFFGFSRAQLRTVTPADALNHPTWRMGGKITLDSATLVNKGLECIEATHLFDIPIDR
ncbi:MAG: hypothetical protein FWE59_05505, partial [Oscillospiraceae bacterium]|nr:hypothetical protein [Oscillospiraceae bacterium]